MHFGIKGQSGGLVGLVIFAGAIGLVAFIVITTIVQRAAGPKDQPPPQAPENDDEVLL